MAVGSIIARIITQYSDKGSKAAQRDLNKLGKQFDDFSKSVFKAFAVAGAAAGAFAIKIGKDAVEGAMEDQKAQAALANALRNTVDATDTVIASTVTYLDKLELATGVNNNELIPSLQRLVTATGDVTQAQQLQQLALDVSAGTGRSLAQVTEAFARALGGSLTALRRIAPTLDENIIKNKDLSAAFSELSEIYGGQAATRAETFEFRMLRLSLAFDQILDSLGYALIPVLENFVDFIRVEILPVLDSWVSANKDDIAASLESVIQNSIKAGKAIARFVGFIADNLQVIKNLGALLFGIFVGTKVFAGITAMVAAVNLLRGAFIKQAAAAGTAAVATAAATGGTSLIAAAAGIVAFTAATGVALGALNNINDATSKTAKSASNLREHMARVETSSKKVATTTGTIFNFTNKTAGAAKKLSTEEQKRLEIKKAINKASLDEFGIKTVSTTDPVSLEAARLNLIKEGNLLELGRFDALVKINAEQAAANLLAQRYADILVVIGDNKVSSEEVSILAAKWAISQQAALAYLASVTGVTLPTGWDDPGKDAAAGWAEAMTALNAYYALLNELNLRPTVTVPKITTPTTPTPTPAPSVPVPTIPPIVTPTIPPVVKVPPATIPVPVVPDIRRTPLPTGPTTPSGFPETQTPDGLPATAAAAAAATESAAEAASAAAASASAVASTLVPSGTSWEDIITAVTETASSAATSSASILEEDWMQGFANWSAPQVTINISNLSGDLPDTTKKQIVDAVVEASGSGYSTNWYRTTGGIGIL